MDKYSKFMGFMESVTTNENNQLMESIKKGFDACMEGRYSNANRDPRMMTLKYPTTCAETKKPLKAGEECVYYPTSKECYSTDSKQAEEYRNWKADLSMGYDY